MNLLKLRILLKVVPLLTLFCLIKWLVHERQWEIGAFDGQSGSLMGSVIFIAAFMMAGTLSDYRASEEVPEQIVTAVESIEDTNLFVANLSSEYNPRPMRAALIEVVNSILLWLERGKPIERVHNSISELNPLFVPLARASAAPVTARLQGEQAKIRLMVSRIQRIRDTDFVPPAYLLLQILFCAAIIVLLLLGGKDFTVNLVISGILFAVFAYLITLIHDLDNPFEYDGKTSVDIDLSLLKRVHERLNQS